MGTRSSASFEHSDTGPGPVGTGPADTGPGPAGPAEATLEARLAELEARVADLESDPGSTRSSAGSATMGSAAAGPDTTASPPSGDTDSDPFWALRGLAERFGPDGGILYTGHVTPPQSESPLSWQMSLTSEAVNEIDFAEAAPSLAAFTHPVRLSLLQAIYEGVATVAELSADDRFGTTGQIYHHLKALSATGWLETYSRGHWRIPPQRVIPLLTLILIGTQ